MPQQTPFIEQLGQQAASTGASNILGMGFGMLTGAINDRRQLKQQQRLQDLQIQGEKEMTDYNMMKQLEMWKNTSYGAQREQMEKAGINPGLLYGMGGAGGATTGTAAGSVQGAEAPRGGHEIFDATQQILQQRMLEAQIANINADTKNKESENPNIGKTGTLLDTQNRSLEQGIANQKAQEAYTKAQTKLTEIQEDIANVDWDIKSSEANDLKATIKYGMRKLYAEMEREEIQKNVDEKTQDTKIAQAKATLVNTVIDTYLKRAQIAGIGQEMQESARRIQNMVQENMRQWDKMSQQNFSLELQRQMTDYNTAIDPVLKELIDNIIIIPGLPKGKIPPVGFKVGPQRP